MHSCPSLRFRVLVTASVLLIWPLLALSQSAPNALPAGPAADLKSLTALVLQLQSQVQELNSQVGDLRTAQQRAVRDSQELRAELNKTKEQLAARGSGAYASGTPASQVTSSSAVAAPATGTEGASSSLEERISKLENDEDLLNDKIVESE